MALNRSELRNWLTLMGGIQSLLDTLDRQLRDDMGISHDDYRILSVLYRSPGRARRMSDLAAEMSYSPSRLTHATARFQKQGWVRKSRTGEDRRGVEIELTAAGVEMARGASKGHLELVRTLVFDSTDVDELRGAVAAFDAIGRTARSVFEAEKENSTRQV